MDLLLATTNPAKLARLRWVVDGLPFRLLTPADLLAGSVHVAEDRSGFAENACQKVRAWSSATGGLLTLASDGGLDIPALGDRWTALRTRRNAGEAALDDDRIQHLLALMQGMQGEDRRAFWHEAVAVGRTESTVGGGTTLVCWEIHGNGGMIIDEAPPGSLDTAFWTESVRYLPAAGKLYRDLTAAELEQHDRVWPLLRASVRAHLEGLL